LEIIRKTKVQQGKNINTTTIPAVISEIMNIQKGDTLMWTLSDEDEVKIRILKD